MQLETGVKWDRSTSSAGASEGCLDPFPGLVTDVLCDLQPISVPFCVHMTCSCEKARTDQGHWYRVILDPTYTSIDRAPSGCARTVGAKGPLTGPLPTQSVWEGHTIDMYLYTFICIHPCPYIHTQNNYGILGRDEKLGHLWGLNFYSLKVWVLRRRVARTGVRKCCS